MKKTSISVNENKRENRVYNIDVKYAKKSFGQSFVDYLGPTYFNLMPYGYKKINKYIYIMVELKELFIIGYS